MTVQQSTGWSRTAGLQEARHHQWRCRALRRSSRSIPGTWCHCCLCWNHRGMCIYEGCHYTLYIQGV